MTISNTDTSVTVQGDGLTTVFNYTFYMGGSSAYASLTYTDENGDETAISSSAFSITGVTVSTGGTFTYPLSGSPIASGTSLTLARVLPLTQNAAVGNQGNFYPSVVEGALDYQMMVAQQISAASGTLDAESLYGNNQASSAAGRSIGIGSGLSFSGTTLVVSGISGSGTVTSVDTGTGLTGGPITGVGTVSMSTITTGFVLANFSGATAAPQAVQLVAGTGITLSSTTTSVTVASSAYALISTSTLATVTASVSFAGIPATYKDIIISYQARVAASATYRDIFMQLNGDTAGNYQWQNNLGFGVTEQATYSGDGVTAINVGAVPGATAATGNAGQCEGVIPNYAGAVFRKNYCGIAGNPITTASGNTSVWNVTGLWLSTSAITSLAIFTTDFTFITGSMFSLYGRS